MRTPRNVVELLQALIRIPSVNPSDNPGVENPGEQACAEYVAEFLSSLGAEASLEFVRPGRPNVIGRFPAGAQGKPRLLLAPHLDTVSIAGMTIDPFGAEVRDGKVWGRGATDTKGSMASMLWALHQMGDRIRDLSHEIWFTGFMNEEAGQDGSSDFGKKYGADFAIVGEPTGLDVVRTHKGALWMTIETHGKSIHASMPHKGENAIYKMADIISYIRDELAPELAEVTDPILGSPTVSVGICNGGSKVNIVPDYCRIQVDSRTIPSDSRPLSRIEDALRRVCPDATINVRSAKALFTPENHPMVQKLIGVGSKPIGAPWFCDAAVLSHAGIPSVAVGPGSIEQAHTCDEWIKVEDLEAGAEFFTRFLNGLSR